MFSASPADVTSCAADRATVRLVCPMRSSFRTLRENVRW